jgi:hypothetical protein
MESTLLKLEKELKRFTTLNFNIFKKNNSNKKFEMVITNNAKTSKQMNRNHLRERRSSNGNSWNLNKIIFTSFFLFICLTSFSQSYLGQVIKQVNFREGAGTDYPVISSLKVGTQIFIVSLETENDFYNIIDITTDKEGYIHKSFVKIGQEVKKNEQGMFTPSGQTANYDPSIEIYNNTKLTLSLKLNSKTYSFAPKQKRTITMSPGTCNYRASAPNVIPNIGTEYMESNQGYTWEFYIITERR